MTELQAHVHGTYACGGGDSNCVVMNVCFAEPAQAAGRSHPGWRNLGDAAEGHRVWTGEQQGTSSAAGYGDPPQSQ